jgi:hypothetical protein
MTCTEHLNSGPLVCTRTDTHSSGHTYESTVGSWVPDAHTERSGE